MVAPTDSGNLAADVARQVRRAGGRAWLVGGAVRDRLLGLEPRDFDLEVDHLDHRALLAAVRSLGRVAETAGGSGRLCVQRARGVVAVSAAGRPGTGPRGFLTIDSIRQDPLSGEIVDPFDGRTDLGLKLLRPAPSGASIGAAELLRVVQLAARFEFAVDPALAAVCRSAKPSGVLPEVAHAEVACWLVAAERPSLGLSALEATGAVRLFPELERLRHLRASNGENAWVRTGAALDHAARIRERAPRRFPFMLAVLVHALRDEAPVTATLARLTADDAVIEEVWNLVSLVTLPAMLSSEATVPSGALRRMALLADPEALALLADAMGVPGGDWLREQSGALDLLGAPPEPLLQERDLLDFGLQPGLAVDQVLQEVFDQQMDGRIATLDQAREAVRRILR